MTSCITTITSQDDVDDTDDDLKLIPQECSMAGKIANLQCIHTNKLYSWPLYVFHETTTGGTIGRFQTCILAEYIHKSSN